MEKEKNKRIAQKSEIRVITGDFSIYTSAGAGTWDPPVRTGNTPEIAAIILK